MDPQLDTRGAVLRRWRDAKDLKQAAVARALPEPVVESTISQWESGRRAGGPSQPQVDAIDRRFGADGCFADMYAAVQTPAGLDADQDWFHNYQGVSAPCWGWARTAESRSVRGIIDAGPFRLEFEVPPGDGMFVQSYGFASNPAVHVWLETPGWVDFGRGTIPHGLGVPILDAVDFTIMGPNADRDPALSAAANVLLKPRFGRSGEWFENLKATVGQRVEIARHLLTRTLKAGFGSSSDLTAVSAVDSHVVQRWAGARYTRLREARGLSLVDAAELASRLSAKLPLVTKDHVFRLEQDRSPRAPELLERLDMAYRADGRSCVATTDAITETKAGTFEVDFPKYWIGPVWIQFIRTGSPGAAEVARLIWKPWRKSLRLTQNAIVTCRRSTPESAPLTVEVSDNWTIKAGVGAHPDAVDVNVGWGFIDATMAKEALAHYYDVVLQVLRGSGKA